MIVVITIFLIITGVILANLPNYREQKNLDLVAQEIVTTIRQTQVYGLSSKKFSNSFVPYGVYFSQTAMQQQFVVFADVNKSSTYEALTEQSEIFRMPPNIRIWRVCLMNLGGGCNATTGMAIFTSPNIDPYISSGAVGIRVTLRSDRTGRTKNIFINASGLIYAQ